MIVWSRFRHARRKMLLGLVVLIVMSSAEEDFLWGAACGSSSEEDFLVGTGCRSVIGGPPPEDSAMEAEMLGGRSTPIASASESSEEDFLPSGHFPGPAVPHAGQREHRVLGLQAALLAAEPRALGQSPAGSVAIMGQRGELAV